MTRPKIPSGTATRVLVAHAHRCCVCRTRKPVQLHHINGRNDDHRDANLAALCTDDHDRAEQKGGLTRKLTAAQIRKYRAQWIELAKTRHLDPPALTPAPDKNRYLGLVGKLNDLAFLGWDEFVSVATSPLKIWPEDRLHKFEQLGDVMAKAFWPGSDLELERAIATFWSCLETAYTVWCQHSGTVGRSDEVGAQKWYESNYPKEDPRSRWEEWSRWDEAYYSLLVDATGAANWVISIVRSRYDDEFREQAGLLAPGRQVIELPVEVKHLDAWGIMAWIEARPHLSDPRECEIAVDALKRIEIQHPVPDPESEDTDLDEEE